MATNDMSKRPAVYAISTGSAPVDVEVVVLRSVGVSGPGTLRGVLAGLEIEGQCPTTVGTHQVRARVKTVPRVLTAAQGEIAWTLDAPGGGGTHSLGDSLAELYFVFEPPKVPFDRDLPADVVRFVFHRIRVTGSADAMAAVRIVTRSCHGQLGHVYDTFRGAASYLDLQSFRGIRRALTFDVNGYMRRRHVVLGRPRVNCYDQACAVQTFAAALGVRMLFIYMDPFGYMARTQLVGWPGACNNPFFQDDVRQQLVGRDDLRRTDFANHAFAELATGPTFDACAGPYLGSGGRAAYVRQAVDDQTTLYRATGGRAGIVADASPAAGVTRAV